MIKVTIVAPVITFILISGCSEGPVEIILPEVNDENCRHENVMKIEQEELRQRFASMCLRRNPFQFTEKPKKWGPNDL